MKKIISILLLAAALVGCEAQVKDLEKSERCSDPAFLRNAWLARHNGPEIQHRVISLSIYAKDTYWIQLSNLTVISSEECETEFDFVE